ncbi:MAG: prenyltransferase/squalene oxidase repeat-containing protein [Fimbriiglobus sp.]
MKSTLSLTALVLFTVCLVAEDKKPAREFQYQSKGIAVPAASADEPKVAEFGPKSIAAAKKYLDDGAHAWIREKKCLACHTSGVYMVERPALTKYLGAPSEEVRLNFVGHVPKAEAKSDISTFSSVWRSSGLASWDKHVTGQLSEATDRSLHHTLRSISKDGSFKTYKVVEIPYITTDFELTVQAARAVFSAPGWVAGLKDADMQERVERMKKYLTDHKPINNYELALKLQLSNMMPELVSKTHRTAAIQMLTKLQHEDGGWSTRDMSPIMKWHEKVDEETIQQINSAPDAAKPGSDPFLTGYAIVLLRESGIPASDPRIQRGIQWLKTNQLESGRWWMRSLYRDTQHYSTYIGTAQALRALALCDELPLVAK